MIYGQRIYFHSASNNNNRIKRSGMRGDDRKKKRGSLFSGSEEEYSFDQRSEAQNQGKWEEHMLELRSAKERFITFLSQIYPIGANELREDVLSHCQQSGRKEKAYCAWLPEQAILRLLDLRIEKMAKNKRIKKNWSDEDVQILIWVISKYCDSRRYADVEKDLDQEDWTMIASLIPGVTADSCMFKWLSLRKTNLAANSWNQDESAMLSKLVEESDNKPTKKNAKDWKVISQRLFYESSRTDKIFRNAKQCREHWNCYLNPSLRKGPWRHEEDILLLECIRENNGSKKWSQIVRKFDGRTENALKNRYTLIIEKQKKMNRSKTQLQIIEQFLQKSYLDQFTNQNIANSQSFMRESQDSDDSFGIRNVSIQTQRINEQFNTKREISSEAAIISPVKVEMIDFKNLIEMGQLKLKHIQPGVLLNGVFQRSMKDIDEPPQFKPLLRKYTSSKF